MPDKTDALRRFCRVDLDETDSTLLCARSYAAQTDAEFTLVTADFQRAGRGQRGNSWESERGQNLLLALVARPTFLPAAAQFRLSEAVALAVADTVAEHTDEVTVKWPNDIYVADRKICGILIEHDLSGSGIATSVIGIGLNVNQTTFRSPAPNPVSLRQLCGRPVDRSRLLTSLLHHFCTRYDCLCPRSATSFRNGDHDGNTDGYARLDADYARCLYRRRGVHAWRDAAGPFRAAVDHVAPDGTLCLLDTDGRLRRYAFKQVQYII